MAQNFAAPIWMTFKQASELDAHIRKGEKGSLVVYADSVKRKETDEKTGDEIDREIPFLKGYTVFNVEQIDGLAEVYYAKAAPALDPVARVEHAEKFFAHTECKLQRAEGSDQWVADARSRAPGYDQQRFTVHAVGNPSDYQDRSVG
jgi:antirestriction protein ArdC